MAAGYEYDENDARRLLVVIFLTGTNKAAQDFQLGADLCGVHVAAADRHVGGGSGVHG